MLTDEIKDSIQAAYRQLLENQGYRARRSQRLMIASIARTLGNILQDEQGKRLGEKHVCMIEAGTGTGKTIAYLIGALPIALAKEKKLIVSTATVLLQEQLMQKDLPDLLKSSGLLFDFAIAKGRGRYLCRAQLQRMLDMHASVGTNQALFEDELASRLDEQSLKLYSQFETDYDHGDWDGDRDSWSGKIDAQDWQRVTTDHQQCTNRACEYFSDCCYFKSRERISDADVIVANHDLVLADLALGGGALLPAPPSAIYIFDEAHHLGGKALNHFSYSFRIRASLDWLSGLPRLLTLLSGQLGSKRAIEELLEKLPGLLEALESNLNFALNIISELLPQEADEVFRLRGDVPPDLRVIAQNLALGFSNLGNAFSRVADQVAERLKQLVAEEKQLLESGLSRLLGHISRMEAAGLLWQSFYDERGTSELPLARWIKTVNMPGQADYELYSSPITAAELFPGLLWSECFAAVLTSATLSSVNSFDRIRDDLGLESDIETLSLPSPFNVYEAAVLQVPKNAGDPRKAEEFEAQLPSHIEALVDPRLGTLVIFTARRQLQSTYERLNSALKEQVLMQDALSRQELIKEHRRRIDAGGGSIIFGLASMTEGVDLPGDYVSHVIIVKLPFAVPDDPVAATYSEWLITQGKDPFWEVSVPDAGLKLKQACGRLLRADDDTGAITLLDRRIITQRYGQALLDTLPNYRRDI